MMDPELIVEAMSFTAEASRVALLRAKQNELEEHMVRLRRELQQSRLQRELDELTRAAVNLGGELDDAENRLRAAILASGQRKTAAGEVKTFTILEYEPRQAMDWAARGNMWSMLKLDKAAFEKVAKNVDLEFVRKLQELKVYLASDLSAFMPKES